MSDLAKVELLTGVEKVNDPRHLDIHNQMRRKLEEGNAFEYFERVVVTTPSTPNTEFSVQLTTLNRTPGFYYQGNADKAVKIYTGATAWSRNKLYLKADVASATVNLLVVA